MNQVSNTRSFSARSVVASLLLGTQPPRLPGAAIVRAAGVLGCVEGTTRVALSRMAAAGELAAEGGWYALTGPLADRQLRQEAGRHPSLRAWDGTWLLAVVGTGAPRTAPDRVALRKWLIERRLAEWREGLWLRPDNLQARPPEQEGCAWITAARPQQGLPIDELWDLAGWSAVGHQLLAEMAATEARVRSRDTDALAPAFGLAADVVRHLRDDPLLPTELLPTGWPGEQLRSVYNDYESNFRAALRPAITGEM